MRDETKGPGGPGGGRSAGAGVGAGPLLVSSIPGGGAEGAGTPVGFDGASREHTPVEAPAVGLLPRQDRRGLRSRDLPGGGQLPAQERRVAGRRRRGGKDLASPGAVPRRGRHGGARRPGRD